MKRWTAIFVSMIMVVAVCVVAFAVPASAEGAIVISHAGYPHGDATAAVIMAGDGKTVSELTALGRPDKGPKDLEYWTVLVVNENNVVTEVLPAGEGNKKLNLVCPTGGYLLGAWLSDATMASLEAINKVAVGDIITLNNVDLAEVRALEGNKTLENASFTAKTSVDLSKLVGEANADAKFALTLDATLDEGTVTVKLTLKDVTADNLQNVQFKLFYDKEKVEPVVKNNGLNKHMIDFLTKAPGDDWKDDSLCNLKEEEGYYSLSYFTTEGTKSAADGEIEITVTFTVKEGAEGDVCFWTPNSDIIGGLGLLMTKCQGNGAAALVELNGSSDDTSSDDSSDTSSDTSSDPSSDTSSDTSSDDSSDTSSDTSSDASSDASSDDSSAASSDTSSTGTDTPGTGDAGVVAIVLLAVVAAFGSAVVVKTRR